MRRRLTITLVAAGALAGCAGDATQRGPSPGGSAGELDAVRRELAGFFAGEGVRVDFGARSLEFDAEVAMDCHDPETPDVYLEVVCCTPDTREHEALVVTRVRPSTVHAALEALGGEPGRPGAWRPTEHGVEREPPAGDAVVVELVAEGPDGTPRDPGLWITMGPGGPTLRRLLPEAGWVFAGSVVRERRGRAVYDADGTGQLVGLHTFGSETVAWVRVESHESEIDRPVWLANNAVVPPMGTPVVVRLTLTGG